MRSTQAFLWISAPPVGRVWFVGLKMDDRRKAVGGAERQTSPPDAEDA